MLLLTKMNTQFFSTSRWSAEFVHHSLRHPPKMLNPAPATYPKTLSGATQNLQFRSSFRSPTSHSPPAVPLHRLHRPRLLSAAAAAAAVSDDGLRIQDGCDDGKMVSATRKGAAVLDQHIPDRIKQAYHVLQVVVIRSDATLNQTNVGSNNNKFYVIQVLESDAGGHFMVYHRWGRVGAGGQDKLLFFPTQGRAIYESKKKFLEKTSNLWSNRKNFNPCAKKYTWLETDYGETEKETNKTEKKGSIDRIKETQLETRIAQFIYLICDTSMMKQQMVGIGYNADKLPLGKLSKSTILKGYDVLKRISNVISNPERGQLEQLTGEFYTVIPHDFGFKKMSEFIIDTPQKLKAKLEMVEALRQIEIATKFLEDDSSFLNGEDDSSDQDDPLYTRYKQLRCDFTPLEVDSEEYSMIKTYLINTHEETHSGYTVDIVQIFKMSRHGETKRFQKFASTGNRMLLWHGSRLSNWAGILSQGLRFHMFGKGVYFADMFSKSANYCHASKASRSGVLLLCEVAWGDMNEVLNGDYKANDLPKGNTKRVGQMTPDLTNSRTTDDGVLVPLGKPTKHESSEMARLRYNDYIVYNTDQIKMRYALHVTFNFKS